MHSIAPLITCPYELMLRPNACPDNDGEISKPIAGSIPTIIRIYKAAVPRQIVAHFGAEAEIWQRNYYEHNIRDEDEQKLIHLYIESNPFNWITDDENPEMRG